MNIPGDKIDLALEVASDNLGDPLRAIQGLAQTGTKKNRTLWIRFSCQSLRSGDTFFRVPRFAFGLGEYQLCFSFRIHVHRHAATAGQPAEQ